MVWIKKPIIIRTPTHLWMVREVSYPPKTLPSCLPQVVVKNRRLKPVADWIRKDSIRKRWNILAVALKRLILVFVIPFVISWFIFFGLVALFVILPVIVFVNGFNILWFGL